MTNCGLNTKGRFGNHIFQYLFLDHHARRHGLRFANPPWLGDDMFCVQPGGTRLPRLRRKLVQIPNAPDICPVANHSGHLGGYDVEGYFTFHTAHYADQKGPLSAQFRYRGEYADYAARLADWLRGQPGQSIAIHIRRGDYGYKYFFLAPVLWYNDWIAQIQAKHGDVTVYVATDDPDAVLPQLGDFRVRSAADIPFDHPGPGFVPDFIALTRARHVAISNSSFSFAATMFNGTAATFVRPSLTDMGLCSYDPWDAPVLFKDVLVDDVGPEFRRDRPVRPKRGLRALRHRLWPRRK